ncbi:hypothetical protein DFJ74DRAFT_458898 [Hyaloraphidium curvatum]|nr:hypothetical protein DFJ74DRAFT_458898 [Hyaloraphidium curvatum]
MAPLAPIRLFRVAWRRGLSATWQPQRSRNTCRRASNLAVMDAFHFVPAACRTFSASPYPWDRGQKPKFAAQTLLSLLKDTQSDAERPAVGRARTRRKKKVWEAQKGAPGRAEGEVVSGSVMEAIALGSGPAEKAKLAAATDMGEALDVGETDPVEALNTPEPTLVDVAGDDDGSGGPPIPPEDSTSPDVTLVPAAPMEPQPAAVPGRDPLLVLNELFPIDSPPEPAKTKERPEPLKKKKQAPTPRARAELPRAVPSYQGDSQRLAPLLSRLGVAMDLDQLRLALTPRGQASPHDNERLEFLGDAVLGFVVADVVYHRFPEEPPGILTELRSRVVRAHMLAKVATDLELVRFVACSVSNKDRLGDAVEALVGAVYVSGGIELARRVVERVFGPYLERAAREISGALLGEALQEKLDSAAREAGLGEVKISFWKSAKLSVVRAHVTAGRTLLHDKQYRISGSNPLMRRRLELKARREAITAALAVVERGNFAANATAARRTADPSAAEPDAAPSLDHADKPKLPLHRQPLSEEQLADRDERFAALAAKEEPQMRQLAAELGVRECAVDCHPGGDEHGLIAIAVLLVARRRPWAGFRQPRVGRARQVQRRPRSDIAAGPPCRSHQVAKRSGIVRRARCSRVPSLKADQQSLRRGGSVGRSGACAREVVNGTVGPRARGQQRASR